eukprot:855150_1
MASSSSSSDAEENENLVTNEMFMREMLSHPDDHNDDEHNDDEKREINKDAKVRRKKRNGSHYRTLDNRDSLVSPSLSKSPHPIPTRPMHKCIPRPNSIVWLIKP